MQIPSVHNYAPRLISREDLFFGNPKTASNAWAYARVYELSYAYAANMSQHAPSTLRVMSGVGYNALV